MEWTINKTKIMEVTPQLAQEWLSTSNQPEKDDKSERIEEYLQHFRKNTWITGKEK